MPQLAIDLIGSVVIAVGVIGAGIQFTRLGGRRMARVASAPAGAVVRLALLTAAVGLWLLIGGWTAVAVMYAIIAWELTVQVAAQVSRARPS